MSGEEFVPLSLTPLLIGCLAAVDRRGAVTRILDRYLAPLRGPDLITAANVIAGAARIATAKPRLADRIAKALLGVSRARYATPECRNVALGAAIEDLPRRAVTSGKHQKIESVLA